MNTSAELEFLNELEDELESELGVGAAEFETELSHEAGAELEAEQFFGALAGLASRAARSPALRRLALGAARSAIRAVTQREFETESGEHELSPIRRVYPDAMMEHLAHEAQEAETEQEAVEAFLPLIPLVAAKALPLAMKAAPLVAKLGAKVLPQLAGKVLPKIAGKVAPRLFGQFMRSAPQMSRAVQGLTRKLWQNQRTRPLLRTVPTIVRRASVQLMKGAMRGRPITPRNAVRAIASNSVRVLSNPRAGVGAYRRSRRLDRRFHAPRGRRAGGGPAAAGPPGAAAGIGPAAVDPAMAAVAASGMPAAAGASGGCQCGRRCPTCGR
jgi:hypothetical protein